MAPPFDASTEASRPPGWRALGPWCFGLAIACGIPFLVIDIPPCADLPQHLAQIRLLDEWLGLQPPSAMMADPLAVNWLGPGNLIYLPLWVFTRVLPPVAAGSLLLYTLLLSQLAAILHCAAKWRATRAQGIWASLFIFNASLYWGFLGFLAGIPFILLWIDALLSLETREVRPLRETRLLGLLLGLYVAHSIWFTVGMVLLVLFTLLSRPKWRVLLVRFFILLPGLALAGYGLPRLAVLRHSSPIETVPSWATPASDKLDPGWFVDAALGGLRSPLEAVVVLGALAWIGLGLWTNRRTLRQQLNWRLVLLPALILIGVYAGPDSAMNAIHFSTRFAPVAMMLLLLATPAPKLGALVPKVLLAGCGVAFLAVTTAGWAAYSRQELSGLRPALASIAKPGAILGLDFIYESAIVQGRPFVQMFAYAQAVHGTVPSFSFARHGSALVVYTRPVLPPWTWGLEWFPKRVEASDLAYFDFVLVNATPEVHAMVSRALHLRPLTDGGRFRLYATDRPSLSP